MRLSKRRHTRKLEVNMTPMIDVTFLLLIFFMTVNQVSKANSEPVELPRLRGTEDQVQATLIINIDLGGSILVSGNRVTVAGLAPLVAGELAAHGGDPVSLNVVLRADRRGDCRVVNEVVDLLTKLEIHKVRIAVQSGEQ